MKEKRFPYMGFLLFFFIWRIIMKKFVFSTIFVFAVALIFVACGSTPTTNGNSTETSGNTTKTNGLDTNGEPDWMQGGVPGYLCGIGSAKPNKFDPTLVQPQAESRGRDKIARTIETKLKSIIKDYRELIQKGEEEDYEANFATATKDIAKQSFSGARELKHWSNKDGMYFSCVCIDQKSFQAAFEGAVNKSGLSQKAKEHVRENANNLFSELDFELEKDNKESEE